MKVPFVDLPAQHGPLIAELTAAFEEVMQSCRFINGDNVTAFEREIADLCGARHGIGLNSGTDALVIALRAVHVGPGDEVITPPFTFGATAESIALVGATPVFADIRPGTFNLDPEKAAARITKKTKAIMPVHLFGQAAEMEALTHIARDAGVSLIADAAQAIGALYQGKPIGAWGDVSTLSFYPTKNLGACGDGGMAVTSDDEIARRITLLRVHGSSHYGYYDDIGYTSRLDELQAAFLRVKARRLAEWNAARQAHAAAYKASLAGLDEHIRLPETAPGCTHVYHQFTVRVLGGRRDALQKHLAENGVGTAVYYPLALHLQKPYAGLGYRAGDLPESERAAAEVLSLPVHPEIGVEQVAYVADCIRAFFQTA